MKSTKKILAKMAIVSASVLVSQAALAVDYACDGPVNGVTVGPGGHLSAASAGGQSWGYFCQVNATTNGVSPEACRAMLAVLLTAQSTGKQVRIWFRDDLNCSAYRGWGWLSTMYWGPALLD